MFNLFPVTVGALGAAAQPATRAPTAAQAHPPRQDLKEKSFTARAASGPGVTPPGSAPPAGQVREHVVDGDGHQDHRDPYEDRVKPAQQVDSPQDDPDAEPGGGGQDQTHGRDASDTAV